MSSILPSGGANPYISNDPYLEKMRLAYRQKFPNVIIPVESFRKSAETGSAPFFETKGETYFLTPDNDVLARVQASENESARRQGRKPSKILPTYSYKTKGGKKFEGTFMGDGAYGGFGKGGYGGLLSEMRAEKGKNPYGPQSTGILEPAGKGLGPVLPKSQREKQLAGVEQAPEYSMGMAGDPFSFTRFGQMAGMNPQPTASFAKSPFDRDQFESLTGFGGVPLFPYY